MANQNPSIFLWPPDTDQPDPDTYIPPAGDWWAQLHESLREQISRGSLTSAAVEELTISSRRIVGLLPNPREWNRPTPWKGIVVGSVQSGKTQSMMGVTAVALDSGYRIVIVLAGMKDDLRTQTARRFSAQLLRQNDEVPGIPGATTLGGPPGPRGSQRALAAAYFRDCTDDDALSPRLRAAVDQELPIVLVIKKTPASLARMKTLLAALFDRFSAARLPTLVLDDECDEASVPGGTGAEKAVPEGITSLWETQTREARFAYLGYTATAAANLLQDSSWALYPNFVWLLRSPGPQASELEYLEPSSDHWYAGGGCFFEEFGDDPAENSNFLIAATVEADHLSAPPQDNPSLADAFRAFFVAGAYRLELQPGTRLDSPGRPPEPHSMMVHSSPVQEDHTTWLRGILRRFGEKKFADEARGFDDGTLGEIFAKEEDLWKAWYDRFTRSRERIHDSRPHQSPYTVVTWEQVRARLPEVFRNVRVKVVNSNAGETLDYEPTIARDGSRLPPRDVYVVAIGGSRLSRGITIKGLTSSYFTRWAAQRHEDTLLQMSRWFGYRGPFLEFCRVFLTREAYNGFREMHENDARLRRRLADLMRERRSPEYATLVFRASPEALPTAKLGAGKIHDIAFSPFTHVFSDVRYGNFADANQAWAEGLARRIRERDPRPAYTDKGTQRGILSRGWNAEEVADLLDALRYDGHNPSDEGNVHEGRFRQPDAASPIESRLRPSTDPYHVAAYLRMWARAGPPERPCPLFSVGISWGRITEGTAPFDFPLLDREITPADRVEGAWTGRSDGWPGDYYFDRLEEPLRRATTERAAGAPGLLLLHVVHKDARGRSGEGTPRAQHTPFVGISIPDGGPRFTHVIKKGRPEE